MGQVLRRVQELEREAHRDRVLHGHPHRKPQRRPSMAHFPDLAQLPPELSLLVLSHLNSTDLCLAACVWEDLGNDELLWQGLCIKEWGHVSLYRMAKPFNFSYKKLYLQLDEATLTFNAEPHLGLEYLIKNRLVEDNTQEIARFLHFARNLDSKKKSDFLEIRRDVLDELVKLQNFQNQFLPNALRKFFQEAHPPNVRGNYLQDLVEKFSERFCACNPQLGLSKDAVYVVCFSLILLSVDLSSPHIKNKMSKREFIRNTRRAAQGINDDFAGHLYDNIYLIGHVAPET